MHPENTAPRAQAPATRPTRGWLAYDQECPFCTRSARRIEALIARRGYAIIPLQTPWVRERLGLRAGDPLREMVVLTTDDRRFGGADAALQLARSIGWAWPLLAFAALPGARGLLRRIYAAIAARRSCARGGCELPPKCTHRDFP